MSRKGVNLFNLHSPYEDYIGARYQITLVTPEREGLMQKRKVES